MNRFNLVLSLKVLIAILILILLYYFLSKNKSIEDVRDQSCENELVKYLKLKKVNSNYYYKFVNKRIFNDTIVFCFSTFNGYTNDGLYGIQSLYNPSYIKYINPKDWFVSCSPIDYYQNGYLYGGAFGQSFMERIGTDGSYKSYFKKYEDTLFYVNKCLFYDDKTAVVSMNGIFVFDRENEKLIWKHHFQNKHGERTINIGHHRILNNYYVFTSPLFPELKTDRDAGNRSFICLDLKTLQVVWSKKFSYTDLSVEIDALPSNNENSLLINNVYGINILDVASGKVIWNYKFSKRKEKSLPCHIDSSNCYYWENDTLNCINFIENKLKWKKSMSNFIFIADFKNYFIYKHGDLVCLLNINNGKVDKTIPCKGSIKFEKIDKYILVDTT
ncbi:MAG: hypothetical protein Q8R57_07485, partial [Bacteroidota bacterium]|nr:hypothetical protein [Bacteroidota bacterium]